MKWLDRIFTALTLITSILLGAVVVGGIGFLAGFVGPIYFSTASQGPLLGFVTGPLGAVVGAVAGAIYWRRAANGVRTFTVTLVEAATQEIQPPTERKQASWISVVAIVVPLILFITFFFLTQIR